MAITQLSKEFKKIRIDHEINRSTMAKALGISDVALQAVELGKAEASNELLLLVADIYGGGDCDVKDITYCVLKEAQINSLVSVVFTMRDLTPMRRAEVVALKDAIEFENKTIVEALVEEMKRLKALKLAAKKEALQAAVLATPLARASDFEELAA